MINLLISQKLTDDDKNQLYYKDEPLTTKNWIKINHNLLPKYAAYQKAIRAEPDLSGRKNGCKWLS